MGQKKKKKEGVDITRPAEGFFECVRSSRGRRFPTRPKRRNVHASESLCAFVCDRCGRPHEDGLGAICKSRPPRKSATWQPSRNPLKITAGCCKISDLNTGKFYPTATNKTGGLDETGAVEGRISSGRLFTERRLFVGSLTNRYVVEST
jgi:hypothetical protein